jgi:hypothetical protein
MVSLLLLEFYRNMLLSAETCIPIFGKLNYSRGGGAFSSRAHISHSRLTKFKGPACAACVAQRTLHGANLRAFWMYTDECCRVGVGAATDCCRHCCRQSLPVLATVSDLSELLTCSPTLCKTRHGAIHKLEFPPDLR